MEDDEMVKEEDGESEEDMGNIFLDLKRSDNVRIYWK